MHSAPPHEQTDPAVGGVRRGVGAGAERSRRPQCLYLLLRTNGLRKDLHDAGTQQGLRVPKILCTSGCDALLPAVQGIGSGEEEGLIPRSIKQILVSQYPCTYSVISNTPIAVWLVNEASYLKS